MKTNSRTILYTMKDSEKSYSVKDMKERCKFTLFKLSYFKINRISLRYQTKDGLHVTILTISGLNDIYDNEFILSDYLIERLKMGLLHDLSNIKHFYLYYSYEK